MASASLNISLDDLAQLHDDLASGDPNAALDFAKATGASPIADVAKEAVKDAAAGAVVGGVVAWVAVQLGVEDIVAGVIIDAAAEVGITVGAGAGLGSTLGPIGAAVGAIVGVLIALVEIGAAKGANGFSSPNPWTDPNGVTHLGTLLGAESNDYFKTHPFNPLLQIQLAQDPTFKDAIANALGPNFDWSSYNIDMANLYALDAARTSYAGWHANNPVYQAFVKFFTTLHTKGVPFDAVTKLIDAYADFHARARAAEDAYTSGLPEGYAIDPNAKAGSSNALTWHVHDMLAAQAFDGVTPHLDPSADPSESFGWAKSFGVRREGDPWKPVSSSPYYKDLSKAVTSLAKEAYAKPTLNFSTAPLLTLVKKESTMLEVVDYAKEKAQEAVEAVYKDGAVTKVGKGIGIAAGIVIVLRVLAGRK